MTSLPVTSSACGNYASIDYNKLHVWLLEGLAHLLQWRWNVVFSTPVNVIMYAPNGIYVITLVTDLQFQAS